ncbi:hypothetical protein D3C81_1921740 [compost metagenome]
MLPGGHGRLVGEPEDHLEFVIVRRWRQHARAEITGEVGGQLLAFAQPGHEIVVALARHAAGHHQGDGIGRHRVSPRNRATARVGQCASRSAGVMGCGEKRGKDYSVFSAKRQRQG